MELLFRMTLRSMIGIIGLDVDKDVLYLRELMDNLGFNTIGKLMRSNSAWLCYCRLRATRTDAMRISNTSDTLYNLAHLLFRDSRFVGKGLKG